MRPELRRALLAILVGLAAGYMLFDGLRALLLGDYVTVGGELGPWAAIPRALGVDPRATAVKLVFVVDGAAWLVALALNLRGKLGRGWMLGFAIANLWYLPAGTALCAVQIALLATAPREAR